MPDLEIVIRNPAEIPEAAAKMIAFAGDERIFLFEGEMGAGKTTIIKEMARALGSEDHFSSPTFSLVNEYSGPRGKIYHFDLYRLNNVEELLDIGIEDYLDSGDYCFFEWPDLVRNLVQPPFVEVELVVKNNTRHIRLRKG